MISPTVNVIGLGYIGLPTAIMLASHGISVVGTDSSRSLIDALSSGRLTIHEEGLDELFRQAVSGSGLSFTTEYRAADVYIVCTATPHDEDTKKADLSFVVSAVRSVLDVCGKGAIIVLESTVPPGTMDRHIRPLVSERGLKAGEDVHLVHAPERVIPGNMIRELVNNPRTIGADDPAIGERIKALYRSFSKGDIDVTDIRTAEMTKVVENTYRDVNIAFANELLKICRSDGLDVNEIIRIANKHPRVNILSPGPGVGGHCICVDPWFLVGDYPELADLIRRARLINDSMPDYVLDRVNDLLQARGKGPDRVGLYGLTYKKDVDDVRNSPSLRLLERMRGPESCSTESRGPESCSTESRGPKSYDPRLARPIAEGQYTDFDRFLRDIDVLVIMVDHSHLKQNAGRIRGKIVLDTRSCAIPWDPSNDVTLL